MLQVGYPDCFLNTCPRSAPCPAWQGGLASGAPGTPAQELGVFTWCWQAAVLHGGEEGGAEGAGEPERAGGSREGSDRWRR